MTASIFPPLFDDEDPDEWPGNEWPRLLEILRAFCLSDAEQDAYFSNLKEPRYHSAMGGDGYTLSAYHPLLADAYDLCATFGARSEPSPDEMTGRLSPLLHEAVQWISDGPDNPAFPYASTTNFTQLQLVRPQLRALCNEALDFFGAEKRAPQMTWEEIAPQ